MSSSGKTFPAFPVVLQLVWVCEAIVVGDEMMVTQGTRSAMGWRLFGVGDKKISIDLDLAFARQGKEGL
jgi:hypothetical protein